MGVAHPKLENLPFRREKTVVQCTSAGQLTGPGTITMVTKKTRSQTKNVRSATSDTPKNLLKLRPWGESLSLYYSQRETLRKRLGYTDLNVFTSGKSCAI